MDTVVWTYMGSSGQLGVRKIVELVDTSRCGHLVKCKPAACKCPSHAGRVASTIVRRLRNGPVYFKKYTLSHTNQTHPTIVRWLTNGPRTQAPNSNS